ncbi:Glycosyl transferase family 43 [Trinorchestia longiramus]|nr:Glycosyl transferase family 43 [Trinorchestia longiramus]
MVPKPAQPPVLLRPSWRDGVRVLWKMTCRRRAERSVLLVLVVAATYLMYSQHVFSNIIFDVPDTYTPNAGGVCMGSKWPGAVLPLYVITPTYPRAEQLPEITRLGQTLLHVHSLVWVVVEDADWPTESLVRFLEELGICHVYLRARMPKKFRDWNYNLQPRGVANRLKALEWITQNAKFGGTIYFADDDNTYDLRLFEEHARETNLAKLDSVHHAALRRCTGALCIGGHVGVSGNERADLEAKQAAASEGKTLNEFVFCRDHYPVVTITLS